MPLAVEQLERRDTPAFTSNLAGPLAELSGDNASDTFRMSATGAFLQHNRFAVGDPGFASATDWDTNVAGTQTLAASSLSAVRFQNLGGGDDEVVLGTGSNPASNINASVAIVFSGAGADRLFVDMLGSTATDYEVTNNTIEATGVNVLYGQGEVTTTLQLGPGLDRVNVASTSADVDIRGNGGEDRVTIGQPSLLTGIVRARNTGGDGNRTLVTVDDSTNLGDGGLMDFADDGAATEVRRGAVPFLRFISDEVRTLEVFGSAGADSYLYRTSSTTNTSLFGGGGDDDFQVNLPGGGRLVQMFGGDGADEFVVVGGLPGGAAATVDGGANPGLDVLRVTPANVGAAMTATLGGANNGVVQANIGEAFTSFSNMEFLDLGTASSLTVRLPNGGAHVATLADDGGPSDPDGLAGAESLLSGSTFIPTQFDSPIQGLAVNLGAEGNTLVMGAMDPSYAPTAAAFGQGTILVGGAGADTFVVLPDEDSLTTVNGGDPTTAPGDRLDVGREFPNPVADVPSGALGTGPGSVVYDGIEEINLTFTDDQFVAGTDRGTADVVQYDPDPTVLFSGSAFPGFTGGVRVAMGDFNGDGEPDIVVGTGPGGATRVRILDGQTRAELFSVEPFEAAFTGGVYVAAGDITGDGLAELVITPDEGGGPRVRVFAGRNPLQGGPTPTPIADFLGIDDTNFRGGARPAIGDLDGDGFGDLVISAGFGGGPRVAAFKGSAAFANGAPKLFNDFFLFEQALRNGAFVAVGDVNGDGKADLVGGGGPGGAPRVLIFSGVDLLAGKGDTSAVLANFFAGDTNSRGGIRVATSYLDGDAKMDLVTGAGENAGSRVTAYLGSALGTGTPPAFLELDPFPAFGGGVFVG